MKVRDSGVPWLGEIPAHWDMTRLKFVARVQTGIALGKDYAGQATSEFPYLRVANVQDGFIDLSEVKTMAVPEREAAFATLRRDDVLMNEGGDADKLGRGAIWDASINPCLHQNHVFALRPMSVSSEWLSTWTGSEFAKAYFETKAKQSTNLASISSTNLLELPIAVPPDGEQHAIVARLAYETARLDALLAAKQRLLDLLTEKRKAIIATAVTRGLAPKARMAPTGVEWIPEAPAHWRPSRVGRLFRQSKVLGFPDLTVLSVYREYGVIERSSRDDNANVLPDDLSKYQLVEVGDLVVNKMKAWQGSLGISDFHGITSPDYVVFRPTHSELPEYLHFMLRTPQLTTVYLSNSNGIRINQWRIEPERFLNVPVLLPPVIEQKKIVEHIARETAKLDAVRAATERTIALLKERRSALIAAAVTGQLDVICERSETGGA